MVLRLRNSSADRSPNLGRSAGELPAQVVSGIPLACSRGQNPSLIGLDKDIAFFTVLAKVESLYFVFACNPQTHRRIEQ